MKILINLLVINLIVSNFVFCQNYEEYPNSLNEIIFIDGKLTGVDGFFERVHNNTIDTINFSHNIGQLHFTKEEYDKLSNVKKEDTLYLSIKFRTYKGDEYFYRGIIPIHEMLFHDYFVVRITNLNLKKQTYYFGIQGPLRTTIYHRKEKRLFVEYKDY